jgi:hypothetical protein
VRHSYVIFGALAALLTIAQTALAQDAFGPIRVAANRSKYAGACPVEVIFTGNINLNTPHPRGFTFNYQWVRSDGAKGRVNVVRPSPGQHMLVVKEPWSVGAPGGRYDLSVTLLVNSGNTHLQQASPVIPISCR